MTNDRVDAIILAGSRPGRDSFAEANDVPVKALIPVAGKPMISHVTGALTNHRATGNIRILLQNISILKDALRDAEKFEFVESQSTIAASLDTILADGTAYFPLLVTTADNVLLNSKMIDQFLDGAKENDIAIAVVERRVLQSKYPASKRTWIKFRGGQYSGANLFYFGSPKGRELLRSWAEVEQNRKKGWKILTMFGPWLLFLAVARLISADQLAVRVSKKLGLKIRVVQMSQPEACIDVDKEDDLRLCEQIMLERGSVAPQD